ncbi:sensor histidine kinase [Rothia uropygialis]|uniref:sensor histidine kinase n=1 Tax=Kocuria sp. 36 TaxID=1415402 RepID=UPI0013EB6628|nr:histidine kinase [Kocuria sp. 36]
MNVSMWRKLASPWYLVSAGPWVALIAIVIQPMMFFVAFLAVFLVMALISSNDYALSFFFFGIPLLGVIFLPVVGLWFGYIERGRLWMMGFQNVPSAHVNLPLKPFLVWLKTRYREPASWRNVLALVVTGVFGIVNTVLLALETLTLATMGFLWIFTGQFHRTIPANELPGLFKFIRLMTDGDVTPDDWWKFPLVALASLIVFAYFNGLLAAVTGSASKALLSPRPEEIERQVQQLTSSRARIMDSFESERRRIERDLHDGVQQELVNLTLRLGMAEYELQALANQGIDVAAARQEVSRAQEQMDHALQTLRNTVRGIYPAVLEDHGLRAALEELANNCMLPVQLVYTAADQLPQDIQRSAYYIASEAVTNTLKHSTASTIWITAYTEDNVLHIEITDNGQGGADTRGGTGVSGLNERVQTMNGKVWLVSPPGGPTTLFGSIPLEEKQTSPSLSVE